MAGEVPSSGELAATRSMAPPSVSKRAERRFWPPGIRQTSAGRSNRAPESRAAGFACLVLCEVPAKGAGFLGLRDKVHKRRAVEPKVHSLDDQVVNGGRLRLTPAAADNARCERSRRTAASRASSYPRGGPRSGDGVTTATSHGRTSPGSIGVINPGLCGWYRRGIGRVTSSGVWPGETRMDTHRPRSSSDRPARKCGCRPSLASTWGKCGVSASDPLHVSDTFMAMTRSVSAKIRPRLAAALSVTSVRPSTSLIASGRTDW
jgi:hypothetical protein